MARLVGGVTIITTVDKKGCPWGFTASAFVPLSLQPPLVLACLDCGADCHDAFQKASAFAVNILQPHHRELAMRFATKGADKFGGGEFESGKLNLPVLSDSLAVLECLMTDRIRRGDHTILIGSVETAKANEGTPAVYFNRNFWQLEPATE